MSAIVSLRAFCRFDLSTDQDSSISGNPKVLGLPFLGIAKVGKLIRCAFVPDNELLSKENIAGALYAPSIETLHSLILLSWGEYGGGRESGLNMYSSVSVI